MDVQQQQQHNLQQHSLLSHLDHYYSIPGLSDHPLGPRRRRPRRASVSREQPRRNGRRRPEQSEQRRQPRRPSADTHRRIGSQPFGVDIGRRVYARVRLHVPDDDGQHTADTDPGGWHDSGEPSSSVCILLHSSSFLCVGLHRSFFILEIFNFSVCIKTCVKIDAGGDPYDDSASKNRRDRQHPQPSGDYASNSHDQRSGAASASSAFNQRQFLRAEALKSTEYQVTYGFEMHSSISRYHLVQMWRVIFP